MKNNIRTPYARGARVALAALCGLAAIAAASAMPSQAPAHPAVPAPAPHAVCATCGTIEAVDTIERKAPAVGSGGMLGALLGNNLEKDAKKETFYRVHVRMQDGKLLAFDQPAPVGVGTQVVVLNNVIAPRPTAQQPIEYRRDDPLEDHYRRYRQM